MKKTMRIHCADCGGEGLQFYANARWNPEKQSFDLFQVDSRRAFCEFCSMDKPIFESTETVISGEPSWPFHKAGDV